MAYLCSVSCGKYCAALFHEMDIHLCQYFLEELLGSKCSYLAIFVSHRISAVHFGKYLVASLFSQVFSLIAISHSSAYLPFGQVSPLA